MDLDHLTRVKPRPATIDLGDGDKIELMYDFSKVTPEWMRDSRNRDEEADPLSMPKALAEVILSWDVSIGDEVQPATAELLARFNLSVQGKMLETITAAAQPSSEEGNGSGEASSTQTSGSPPPEITSPNGTTISESPTVSASPSPQ